MSLLDRNVDQAITNRPDLGPLRVAVEKELLHQDILRILADNGYLAGLVFMGGTCLRLCHGSNRLSEDLDFAGGACFQRTAVDGLVRAITDGLSRKYGLAVSVGEPVRESGDTDTWRIKIQTRPENRDVPAQRINLDICAVPGRDSQPQMILNPYGVDMGTSGLVVLGDGRHQAILVPVNFVEPVGHVSIRPLPGTVMAQALRRCCTAKVPKVQVCQPGA